ncbi:CubicO group peptidase (beta-lactamase class C family) [Hydrotalea sandarakina]|uniref:CubicO group peptidase (Beta-lactamase class C family) n=2 Tax=Hydrotalea sandarakina TaxID=1004304 RepID=A0A2W7S3W1_9BACT|nr:CubicO group peptidase (beta-lactamase class C family) [Hydrotalea sandarakina]
MINVNTVFYTLYLRLLKLYRMRKLLLLSSIFSCFISSCQSQQETKNQPVTIQAETFHFNPLTPEQKKAYADAIAPLYKKDLLDKGFNGAILMAKNGEVVFEDYHGYYNFKNNEKLTPDDPFHLASISKTFTAMTLLRLWEQGRINLNDTLQKFFPQFPYQNITITELLSHRSGLPNYVYFMDEKKAVVTYTRNKRGRRVKVVHFVASGNEVKGFQTNEDVLNYMIKYKPAILALPNKTFHYCNTNYALLALIIERVTHIPFPQYMKDSVFNVLGMKHTFVFNIADTANYVPSYQANKAPFKLEKLDCIYGDKNVYSTVRDMLLWDRALYEGTFVRPQTLSMAFEPQSHETRSNHNYGLGWRMLLDGTNGPIIYHNGWWHGNNTVFTRLINDTATLIILGNKYNRNIYSARKLTSVFSGTSDTSRVEE